MPRHIPEERRSNAMEFGRHSIRSQEAITDNIGRWGKEAVELYIDWSTGQALGLEPQVLVGVT
jgi:hypothetical protein